MPVNVSNEPYTDTGTGAYPNPPAEVTHETSVGTEPTGLVDGPPESVTYTSEDYGDPTGAHPNPPAEVSYSSGYWPVKAKAESKAVEEPETENKAITEADNKAVTTPDTKKKSTKARKSTKKGA